MEQQLHHDEKKITKESAKEKQPEKKPEKKETKPASPKVEAKKPTIPVHLTDPTPHPKVTATTTAGPKTSAPPLEAPRPHHTIGHEVTVKTTVEPV